MYKVELRVEADGSNTLFDQYAFEVEESLVDKGWVSFRGEGPAGNWQPGNYEAAIFARGELMAIASFTVREQSVSRPPDSQPAQPTQPQPTQPPPGTVPGGSTTLFYQINITGTGGFPSGSSVGAGQPFSIQGILMVTSALAANPGNPAGSSPNPVEIAIFTNPGPIVGRAGALYFASNTALTVFIGSNLGPGSVALANTQLQVDGGNTLVTAAIQEDAFGMPSGRYRTLNIYNLTSGVAAQVHNVLTGGVSANFAADGQTVVGRIELGGSSGFGGPNVTSLYIAEFTGIQVAGPG